MGFAAGYGMAMISYVQIYYVCEFGEDIEVNIHFKILDISGKQIETFNIILFF